MKPVVVYFPTTAIVYNIPPCASRPGNWEQLHLTFIVQHNNTMYDNHEVYICSFIFFVIQFKWKSTVNSLALMLCSVKKKLCHVIFG
jgi:hypothetical protein